MFSRRITTLFRSSCRKPKRFRSLCRLRIPVNIVLKKIETARHLVRSDFFAKIYTNFEIRRRVPRVKKTDEIQKEHTSLSLSTCRSADGMFTLMCLHQSLSLYICKQIRPEWYSG